jgi:Ca-activated chloride channel homolog
MKIRTFALLSSLVVSTSVAGGYALSAPASSGQVGGVQGEMRSGAEAPASSAAVQALAEQGEAPPVGPRLLLAGTVLVDGRLGHAALGPEGGETYVAVTLRGADVTPKLVAPVALSLVIDRSGSMRGSRIKNAIEGAAGAVSTLRDGDVVSVVTFDTRTQQVVAPTVVDGSSRKQVIDAIRAITLGGDTCISCGLDDSLKLLASSDDRVRRIILLSDGEANHGVRDVPGFRLVATRAREAGVTITTVGVDVDYNDRVMTALAMGSNGRHHFVENDASLPKVFRDETEAMLSTVATGAQISLDLAPGVTVEQVYARAHRRDGASVKVPMGIIPRGEVRVLVARLRVAPGAVLPSGNGEASRELVKVSVAYRDQVNGGETRVDGRLGPGAAPPGEGAAELDPNVGRWLRGVETSVALADASTLYSTGAPGEATRRLDAQARVVTAEIERVTRVAPSDTEDLNALREQLRSLESTRAALQKATTAPGGGAAPVAAVRASRAALRQGMTVTLTEAGF